MTAEIRTRTPDTSIWSRPACGAAVVVGSVLVSAALSGILYVVTISIQKSNQNDSHQNHVSNTICDSKIDFLSGGNISNQLLTPAFDKCISSFLPVDFYSLFYTQYTNMSLILNKIGFYTEVGICSHVYRDYSSSCTNNVIGFINTYNKSLSLKLCNSFAEPTEINYENISAYAEFLIASFLYAHSTVQLPNISIVIDSFQNISDVCVSNNTVESSITCMGVIYKSCLESLISEGLV